MMDEEIRQALCEVREMKQMCGNINMKLTNIVTQRGQDIKKKFEAEYQRGLSEGNDIGYKDGVKDGQNEAWECAKKLFSTMSETEIEKVFPTEWENGFYGLMQMKPQYAIEKLKAYEEKQSDKIKVGDEVKHDRGWTAVVTQVDESGLSCVDKFGAVASYSDISRFSKTDRHFDIDKILEGLRYDD